MRIAVAPIVIFNTAMLAVGIALVIAGLIVFASGSRTTDMRVYEARATIARRLIGAAFVPLALEMIGTGSPVAIALVALGSLWAISWLPLRRRRVAVAVERSFRVPAESLAAVMFDVSTQSRWMHAVIESVNETPGLLRVGSVVRQRIAFGDRSMVVRRRVTLLEPYRRLELALDSSGGASRDLLEVTPQGDGSRARLSGTEELSLIGAVTNGWRLGSLRHTFEEQRAASLERLRRLVE